MVCAMFQVDSSHTLEAKMLKVIFDLFAFSDPKIQDGHPKINRRLMIYQLIAVTCFETLSGNHISPL